MINHEEMSERKLKILHAIIQNYLETGEPVGSRTISKYTDLNLSSATIRNEMADLEEMGYIIQPHTSAGRIPSDKGYRLYVDMLMEEKEQELNEMQDQMLDKADKMDQLLKQAAKVLAREIGCSDKQVRDWVKIYQAEGEAGLEPKKKPGNPLSRYERRKELTYEEQLQYQIERLKRELVKKEAEVLRLKKLNERKGGDTRKR